MILYFSATGNSRYIAKLLAKSLGDEAVDAGRLMKEYNMRRFFSEKPYVFVSPVYAWRFPKIFEEFMECCRFNDSKRAYFVLTCGGDIGVAGKYIEKFAKAKGFEYMGTSEVVMPDNYLIMFDPPPKELDEKTIGEAEKRAFELASRIAENKPFDKQKSTIKGHICSDIVTPMFYKFYISADKFYSTDACISCGVCAESCVLNNIKLEEGRPAWGDKCTHCVACISRCPVGAIEYGKSTNGRRRYTCPKNIED